MRALEARARGDEAEVLRETVRAVSLDREPLPQLSAGAWQMKERGIEVAAVQVWREVKAQAVEVARVAQELADRARSWLKRAAERLSPERGLSHAGGAGQSDSSNDRQDLAARTRAAVQGIDREALAGRAAELQQGRQAEERQRVQEAERLKEQEQWQEREERHHDRDDGLSH